MLVPELRTQLKHRPKTNIGIGTYAGGPINIIGPYPVNIGKFCSFAWDVTFCITAGHHPDCISTYPFDNVDFWLPEANGALYEHHKGLEVNIGNDVWVCSNATIMHNSPIGDGAVVGGYSVVREAVRPYAVVIGNPAVEVARRFDDETVEKLLAVKWWSWDESKIRKHMDIITSPDVEGLCSIL